jgi:hypothetical protein
MLIVANYHTPNSPVLKGARQQWGKNGGSLPPNTAHSPRTTNHEPRGNRSMNALACGRAGLRGIHKLEGVPA